ncbi:hypothetical protein ACFO1B_57460, partial [Dactylosporangium siamense]|uniref:hypothetical protein n=1 Tax=Dactylosporangium siamense TaxID=685454 RepID=UPI00360AE9BF
MLHAAREPLPDHRRWRSWRRRATDATILTITLSLLASGLATLPAVAAPVDPLVASPDQVDRKVPEDTSKRV